MIEVSTMAVGDEHELTLVEGLTRTQIVQYAGASGDFSPLHTDEPFAINIAGHPAVLAHGMLTMGMTGRLLTELAGPEGLLSYGARFVALVWPGDNLTAHATVDAVRADDDGIVVHVVLRTVNQRNETVLTGAAALRPRSA